jgi:radical SAM protein with 4Fe4S-binding SPASM domain
MTPGDCTRIVSEAAELGVKTLAFSGGEPLIWSPIDDAVNHAAKLGIEVSIYTSGNVDAPEKSFQSLTARGCNRFVFSMFGASAATHERVTRIRGSFQKTLTAIAVVRGLRAEAQVHFVPFADNFAELAELAELAKRNDLAQISVLRFVPQGRGQLFQRHSLSQLQNLQLKKTIERLRENGFAIRTGSPYNVLLLNNQPECCSGIDRLIIGPELDIYPCDAFKQVRADEVVGTADYSRLDRFSLQDCWEKSPFLRIVREYLTTPFGALCNSCSVLGHCLSGCLAQKVIAHGNFDKRPDPACLRGKG